MRTSMLLGLAPALAGCGVTLLSFLNERTVIFLGGNSAHLHGYPLWFLNFYFDDLVGPGVYFEPTAFVLDVLVWFLLATGVMIGVKFARQSMGPKPTAFSAKLQETSLTVDPSSWPRL